MNFDAEGFEALVWNYGTIEGIITPRTWEKIVCDTLGGVHTPGDIYMSDGHVLTCGLNIKTLTKKFTKGHFQTCDVIQCRCPLDETLDIGKGVINTLLEKREDSFVRFNLDTMMDVLILHNREDNQYNVRMFMTQQDKYENLNLTWIENRAYLNSSPQWKLKRIPANERYGTCVYVKKKVDSRESMVDLKIRCNDEYDISIEEAKKRYAKALQAYNVE